MWVRAENGVLQGCPASPLILAALMLVWVTIVRQAAPGIDLTVYLDDRTIWAPASQPHLLKQALAAGDEVDSVLGWTLNKTKCQLAGGTSEERADIRLQHNYAETVDYIETLGLKFDLNDEAGTTYKGGDKTKRLNNLLNAISVISEVPDVRRIHVRSYILPALVWAGGFALRDAAEIAALRGRVRQCISGCHQVGTAPAVLAAFCGIDADAGVIQTFAALQLGAQHGFDTHAVRVACTEVGASIADGVVTFMDGHHVRSWVCGLHNEKTLKEMVAKVLWHKSIATTRATGKSRRKRDPEQAQGLTLPLPTKEQLRGMVDLTSHVEAMKKGNFEEKLVAAGTGCNMWQVKAKHKDKDGGLLINCLCGLKHPSRPHLVWVCPALADIRARHGVTPPTTLAEERLFARILPHPPEVTDTMAFAEVVEAIRADYEQFKETVIATDGSHKDGVSGASIATRTKTLGWITDGLEEGGEFAELVAGHTALRAVHELAVRRRVLTGNVDIIMDCSFAAGLLQGKRAARDREIWITAGRRLLTELASVCDVSFTIVPPHGKSKNWKSGGRVADTVCRALNAKAHHSAWGTVQAVLHDTTDNTYGSWHLAKVAAVDWQRAAIKLAAEVHTFFAASVAART